MLVLWKKIFLSNLSFLFSYRICKISYPYFHLLLYCAENIKPVFCILQDVIYVCRLTS